MRARRLPRFPDLLRTVPGVEVANQQTGGQAVAIRGFNNRLTNSLLVMVDGRSIYVTTMSGVFWDQLLMPLSDIERIEVVRGPGATLWGANAVNGVINIITKHSGDTLGITAEALLSKRRKEVSLAVSDRITDNLSFRVSGNFRHDNGLVNANGDDISRRWIGKSLGVRLDYQPNSDDAFTVQGEYSDGKFDAPFNAVRQNLLNPGYDLIQTENDFETKNVLARWAHQGEKLDWTLQAYYDSISRKELNGVRLHREIGDIDLGIRWQAGSVHEINAGIGARIIHDRLDGTPAFYFHDPVNTDKWVSGYVQDDISLIPEKLRLTVGTKLEHNNFTGVEIQPSAKLFFRPNPKLAVWGGVSRAVRTPSQLNRHAEISFLVDLPGSPENPFPLPLYTMLRHGQDCTAEVLIAYEAGLRAQLAKGWSIDVASYYNDYKRLSSADLAGIEPLFLPPIAQPVGLKADVLIGSSGNAKTWGVEAVLTGEVTPWWKVEVGYSHFDFKINEDPATQQKPTLLLPPDASPRHQAKIENSFDFNDKIVSRSAAALCR